MKDGQKIAMLLIHLHTLQINVLLSINFTMINQKHMEDGDFISQRIQICKKDGQGIRLHFSRLINKLKTLFQLYNTIMYRKTDGDFISALMKITQKVGLRMELHFMFTNL